MKIHYFFLVFMIIALIIPLSVSALFGRVFHYQPYYHVCYRINGLTYNYYIAHNGTYDFGTCGEIEITNDSIQMKCGSLHGGSARNHIFNGCDGGKSCILYGFYNDHYFIKYKTTSEPSFGHSYGGSPYGKVEQKDVTFNIPVSVGSIETGNNQCPAAGITPKNSINLSKLNPGNNKLEITTDIEAVCKYSNISGSNFSDMALFASTNSTTHALFFNPSNSSSTQYFYIKCIDEFLDVNEGEYILAFTGYNTSPIIISTNPINNSVIYERQDSISMDINTDQKSICRYSNFSNTDFYNMSIFSRTNSISHTLTLVAEEKKRYALHFRCENVYGYANDFDYEYSFSTNFTSPKIVLNTPSVISENKTTLLSANFSDDYGFSGQSCELCLGRSENCNNWNSTDVVTTYNNNLSGTCSYNWNVTAYNDDYYYTGFQIKDTSNNTGHLSKKVTLDRSPPAFTGVYPWDNGAFSVNNINTTNGTFVLDFYILGKDLSDVSNCSLIVNGVVNYTASPPPFKKIFNFEPRLNISSDVEGTRYYNWSVTCTDVWGYRVNSETRFFTFITLGNFSGDTTDFTKVNLSRIENLTFEQLDSGKIKFLENVNLSGISNINNHVKISFNRIEINSTALGALNKSALLYFYNLTYNSTPKIIRDNVTCPDYICKAVNYSNGVLIMNVTQFSIYTTEAPDNIGSPSDGTSASSGGSSGGSSSGGGGGGSGGGTAGFVCNHEWQCSEWSVCLNGFQTRECNFAKVPQHVQDNECQDATKSLATTQTCGIKKETKTEQNPKINENQIQISKNKNNLTQNKTSNSISGAAIANPKQEINLQTYLILSIAAIVTVGFFLYRRISKPKL